VLESSLGIRKISSLWWRRGGEKALKERRND
jgi:hypothetical protein